MAIFVCGAVDGGEEEAIRAVSAITRAGDIMRTHRAHFPDFGRTEGGAYTIACCCGWFDPDWYEDVGVMIASFQLHQEHPHFPEHGIHPKETP